MLKERQKSILDAIVQEYIKTAQPVSSRDLMRYFKFEVGPATVRNEMLHLDELGYLEQPYTSAGRVPTDRGYRFFVDYLTEDEVLNSAECKILDEVFRVRSEDEFARKLCRVVSRLSGTLSAVMREEENTFYESGFSEILDEPEFSEPDYIRVFGQVVDLLEERMKAFIKTCDLDGIRVFIGKENPWREARPYSMIVSSWQHPEGFEGVLTLIGPKRTNYRKHKAIIRNISSRRQKS